MEVWKERLGIQDTERLRYLFNTCVVSRAPLYNPSISESKRSDREKYVLNAFITVHEADGYDEHQWDILNVVLSIFENEADAFWAFTMIVGLQRPYRPIHGERIFAKVVETVASYVQVELVILDMDLATCMETSLKDMLSSVVARWFSTWFACIGAGVEFYTATLICPAKLRTRWLSLVTAALLLDAAGDMPRIYARRNDIYRAFSRTRITNDIQLIKRAQKRL